MPKRAVHLTCYDTAIASLCWKTPPTPYSRTPPPTLSGMVTRHEDVLACSPFLLWLPPPFRCFCVAGVGMALLCWLPADHPGFRVAYAVSGAAVSGSFVTLNVAVQQVGGPDRARTNTLYRMVGLAGRIVFAFGCAQLIESYPAQAVGPLVFRSITAASMVLMLAAANLLLGYETERGVGTAEAVTPTARSTRSTRENALKGTKGIPTPGAARDGATVTTPSNWGGWLASLVSPYKAAVVADPRLLQLVLCTCISAGTVAVMTQHCTLSFSFFPSSFPPSFLPFWGVPVLLALHRHGVGCSCRFADEAFGRPIADQLGFVVKWGSGLFIVCVTP